MTEYMIALRERFNSEPPKVENLRKKLKQAREEVSECLNDAEQDMLLNLLDLEAELRDETSLSSFISGYLKAAEDHGVLPMFYLELTTGLRRENWWPSYGVT